MNITKLHLKNREIVLIGTAHISRESIEEVQQTIQQYAASGSLTMLCIELDSERLTAMTQKEHWEKLDIAKIFREGKGFLFIANLILASFQRRTGSNIGVQPGEEMKCALETAQSLSIPFSLCDRNVQITLRRAWIVCGFWNKCKLLASLIATALSNEKMNEEEIEKLKNTNELDSMMDSLATYLPPVKKTLIDERDYYLAANIWTAVPEEAGGTQIAVVGAGHIAGICTHLEKMAAGTEVCDVEPLNTIPQKSFLSSVIGWLFPLVLVGLIVAGFFRAGTDVSITMIIRWILWNGSLAALGTLIALGHPLSILTSFFGAPIATINPFIGIGIFSGLVEVTVRKPQVHDAQTIATDISSIKGIYRNRIGRALLVFLFSSLGGAIGNFISIPALASLLTAK
ncbi:MAG: TraB/GumN family protein [Treponema sp.]|jgi:pheromone shutdown-related protein TraB|nr:TraB/GumN family protein [Treponema sp.]